MSWAEEFYSVTGRWWGGAESAITTRHHDRVETVRRLTGLGGGRLLDLGASYGNTAAAFALAGYDVTGVELSDRIDFAGPHLDRVGSAREAGRLELVRADFTAYELRERVDVVTYWNGFGVGDDADQRNLLNRMADHWLTSRGRAVLDVLSPPRLLRWAGERTDRDADAPAGYPYAVHERTDFDPVRHRFVDTWWRDDDPGTRYTQSLRCYAPVDLLLLVEPTALEVVGMEVDGVPFDPEAEADAGHPLFDAVEYQVVLRPRS